MSLRHSGDNLSPQVCTICRENLNGIGTDEVLRTSCNHQFHRNCLLTWLKRNATCPQCRTHCNSREFGVTTPANRGARTRSRATSHPPNNPNMSQNLISIVPSTSTQALNQSQPQNSGTEAAAQENNSAREPSSNDNNLGSADNNDDSRIRSIVSAVVSARQATIFQDLDERVNRIIEGALSNALSNLNLVLPTANPAPPDGANPSRYNDPEWPRDMPNFPENNNNRPSNISQNRFDERVSDITVMNNYYKVANLINSWDIKFDGSARLSVDNFIYRIESLVHDTLNGNFNLFCEHVQCLFTKEAKDWYWHFRRTVNRVTWPVLCEALRTNFEQHRSDIDIKEDMRARRQTPSESFDDYKNAIYKIAEDLSTPLREQEIVDILQRGLRPKIRQQLLYVNISSVADLRRLCIKGENLLKEISKSDSNLTRGPFQRRPINEVFIEGDEEMGNDVLPESEISELARGSTNNLVCWNCRNSGHRYFDCLEDRTTFCYGCGAVGIYKPNCNKCSPGNLRSSEGAKQNLRQDHSKAN